MIPEVSKGICDHAELVIPVLVVVAGGTCTVLFFMFRQSVKFFSEKLDGIEEKLSENREHYYECQKNMPVVYVRKDDLGPLMETIKAEISKLFEKLDGFVERFSGLWQAFRTKEEAGREWRSLETRLTKIESDITNLEKNNAERHREIWDKLNRVVDFMKDEREKLERKINALGTDHQ